MVVDKTDSFRNRIPALIEKCDGKDAGRKAFCRDHAPGAVVFGKGEVRFESNALIQGAYQVNGLQVVGKRSAGEQVDDPPVLSIADLHSDAGRF